MSMNRRTFLKLNGYLFAAAALSIGSVDCILSQFFAQDEAKLRSSCGAGRCFAVADKSVNDITILTLKGSPYDMGLQHGKLMRDKIRESYSRVIGLTRALSDDKKLDEAFSLIEPFIPEEESEEMLGLANGAGLPAREVHWFHTIPTMYENNDRRRFFRDSYKNLSPGPTCSNIAAFGKATDDGRLCQLRVLDWSPELGVQNYPAILIHRPDNGYGSATFSFAGYIGCVSGMNEAQLCFGEEGNGDPKEETMEGMPFPFLFRKMMRQASGLADTDKMIESAKRTNSYIYLIGDGKARDATLYDTNCVTVRDSKAGARIIAGDVVHEPLEDIVYHGHDPKTMHRCLANTYGSIGPDSLMSTAKDIAMASNCHNVIFSPQTMEAWVSNSRGYDRRPENRAFNQRYFHLDVKRYL